MFSNCLQNMSEIFILKIANQPENTVGISRWLHNTCVSSLFTFMQSIIILTLGYSSKNGSVLRTNLSLSRIHKLAPPAPLYTKFTVCGMRCRKFWYEMEKAGFFNTFVPLSKLHTMWRSSPGANSFEKFKYHLHEILTDADSSLLLDFFAFFEMYTDNSWMMGTCSLFERSQL
jgi:hypothetical protein